MHNTCWGHLLLETRENRKWNCTSCLHFPWKALQPCNPPPCTRAACSPWHFRETFRELWSTLLLLGALFCIYPTSPIHLSIHPSILATPPAKTAPFSAATSSSRVLFEHSGFFWLVGCFSQRTCWLGGTQNHRNIWAQQKAPLNPLKSASQSPFQNRWTVRLVKKEFMTDASSRSDLPADAVSPRGKASLSPAGAEPMPPGRNSDFPWLILFTWAVAEKLDWGSSVLLFALKAEY